MQAGESLRPQLLARDLTVGSGDTVLTFRTDGNLDLTVKGALVWRSGTEERNVSRLTMQADGNLAIVDNSNWPVWASDTAGHAGASLQVESGDATVISPTGDVLWSARKDASRHVRRVKKARGDSLIAQLALNPIGIVAGKNTWVGNVIGTAGRQVAAASHDVQDESGKITKALNKIPIVGPLFVGLYDAAFFSSGLGPAIMTEQIVVEGYGVDKVMLAELKKELKDFKAVGPYAQMICSFIPGVGTYIAGAIGCGLALANGEPIGEAILDGVEGALPGGPLAKMACDVAKAGIEAAVEHKKITWTSLAQEGISAAASAIALPEAAKDALEGALTCATHLMQGQTLDRALVAGVADALPVSKEAKGAMNQAIDIAHDIAQGQRVDRVMLAHVDKVASLLPIDGKYQRGITAGLDVSVAVAQKKKVNQVLAMRLMHSAADIGLDYGRKNFPQAARSALQIGMSVTHARMVQSYVSDQISGPVARKLMSQGQQLIARDSVLNTAYKSMVREGHEGFQVGVAAMHYRQNVNQLVTLRNSLSEADKSGFDLACSLHVGRVTTPPSQKLSDPHAQIGYYLAHGVQGGFPTEKQAQIQAAIDHPVVKVGVEVAMNKIALSRASWWTKLLYALGIKSDEVIS
jgi:hypothetical protein